MGSVGPDSLFCFEVAGKYDDYDDDDDQEDATNDATDDDPFHVASGIVHR